MPPPAGCFPTRSLGDAEAPALAAYVATRGASRAAADTATAVTCVMQAAPAERAAAYREARNLIRHSYRKEMAALASVRRLGPKGRTSDYIGEASQNLEDLLVNDLRALEKAYTAITGQGVPNIEPSKEEQAMAAKVYVPLADAAQFLDALGKAKPVEGLHSMMRFEIMNFADGRRNALEVYEAVAAEALSAGEWYYGQVKPADVRETLERAAKAGAFTVKGGK